MRRTPGRLLPLLALVVLLAPLLHSAPADATFRWFFKRIRPDRDAVQLQQASFELSGPRFLDTDWGRVVVDTRHLHSGYLQVLTCRPDVELRELDFDFCQWSLRNVYLPPRWAGIHRLGLRAILRHLRNHEPTPLAKYLDLWPMSSITEREERILTDSVVDELQGIVVLCAVPIWNERQLLWRLERLGGGLVLDTFPVEPVLINAAGDDGEVVSTSIPVPPSSYLEEIGPPPPGPDPPPPPPLPQFAFPEEAYRPPGPNENSAENQCVPIAHANNFAWLTESVPRWNAAFPHDRGWAADTDLTSDTPTTTIYEPNEWFGPPCDESPTCPLVAVIDAFTRREDVQNANTGEATERCQQIRGIFGFLRNLEVQGVIQSAAGFVNVRHQGSTDTYGRDQTCHSDVLPVGLQSVSEGEFVDWDWLFEQLTAEYRGVVCSYGRYDKMDPATRKRTGGHMQALYGVWRLNGTEVIYMYDDAQQGSTGVNSSVGLQEVPWEIEDTNGDGRPNLDGTTSELEFCISFEGIPQPLEGPTL